MKRMLAGTFPMVSFYHVPKQMPVPQWLMMGTAFAIDIKPFADLPPRSGSSTKDSAELLQSEDSHYFLAAAHTLLPWRVFQTPIPPDYAKSRYVTATLYGIDDFGHCDVAQSFPLSFVRFHPTLDVALLRVKDTTGFDARLKSDGYVEEGNNTPLPQQIGAKMTAIKQWVPDTDASGAEYMLPRDVGCIELPDKVTLAGFRGKGDLGNPFRSSPEEMARASQTERDRLKKQSEMAVGQQEVSMMTARTRPGRLTEDDVSRLCKGGPMKSDIQLSGSGLADVISGQPYSGMSGAPLMVGTGCVGIMVSSPQAPLNQLLPAPDGAAAAIDTQRPIVFVPSNDIVDWLLSLNIKLAPKGGSSP